MITSSFLWLKSQLEDDSAQLHLKAGELITFALPTWVPRPVLLRRHQ